jgi:hypothetical protein
MSWALPLPEAMRRRVWAYKTQSPTAAIVSEPVEALFARGGHIKSLCEMCDAVVVRVGRHFAPRYCDECSRDVFEDHVVSAYPEYMWEPLWDAYDDMPDASLYDIINAAQQLLLERSSLYRALAGSLM